MTDARDATTKDLFTYVTYAVMNNSWVIRAKVKDDLILNFDGTFTYSRWNLL